MDIEAEMKFVTERLEKNTIPLSIKYSLASIAASMKRIADRMDGVNGGVQTSSPPMSFYQIEQVLGQIRDRLGSGNTYSPSTFTEQALQQISNALVAIHNNRL
jgi:hypothetical protein